MVNSVWNSNTSGLKHSNFFQETVRLRDSNFCQETVNFQYLRDAFLVTDFFESVKVFKLTTLEIKLWLKEDDYLNKK